MTTLLFEPPTPADTAPDSLAKDLGQFAQLEARLVELRPPARDPAGEHRRARARRAPARARAGPPGPRAGAEAWPVARMAFDALATARTGKRAADACDVLYQTEQAGSLAALGSGIWLGVTFPIDPESRCTCSATSSTTPPDDADGAAVAAATAAFLADLRAPQGSRTATGWSSYAPTSCSGGSRGATAGRRPGGVRPLGPPPGARRARQFLVRLRNVVDVLVQDDWWIDRAHAIQSD